MDAIGAHEESIIQYMKDYDANFRILEEPLMKVGIGVAFSKMISVIFVRSWIKP